MPQDELHELREELKKLTIQISSLMEKYERVLETLAHNNLQVGQNVQRSTQGLQQLQNALPQSIQSGAYQAIKEGMAQTIHESKDSLRETTSQLKFEADQLKDDRDKIMKLAKWLSFKTLALVYGSALLVWLASGFFSWENIQDGRQAIRQAEWTSSINAAIDKGKLAACSEGGLCANVNGKSIRLDK